MIEIVGLVFPKGSKVFYADPGEFEVKKGDWCVVATETGEDLAQATESSRVMKEKENILKVIRKATHLDFEKQEKNNEREKEGERVCREKIEGFGLPMKLISVHLSLDQNKFTFYFSAEERVDFRELVKDLSISLGAKIELLQINIRDEIKLCGGFSWCGRPICCTTFLKPCDHIAVRMVKDQNLSVNTSKVSGVCGRLMCCLSYEQDFYSEFRKKAPKEGSRYQVGEETGTIEVVSPIRSCLIVRLPDNKLVEVPIKV
ncbi:MAG: regulatory iron-sulfur-containing complex subunit RicT [Candidatus Desantisbacteria bacterium]